LTSKIDLDRISLKLRWLTTMSLKQDEQIVTLKVKKKIVELIDLDRSKYSSPRSSWVIQAVVEKLERLGYEIK